MLPEDRERARVYAHLHLEDFVERASEFRNEAIVLTHFSQRYRVEEIRQALPRLCRRRWRSSGDSDFSSE